MPFRKGDALRTAQAAAVIAVLDGGTGPGYVEIRTGSQPATPATTATGTLLATVVLEEPSWVADTAGVLDLEVPAMVTGVADGTAGWCRWFDGDDVAHFDGEVTTTAGSGVLRLSNLAITSGGDVTVTGGTYTVPM